MDHHVTATLRYFEDMEEAQAGRCYRTALRNGHTAAQADECDDGSVGCPDCPFLVKGDAK